MVMVAPARVKAEVVALALRQLVYPVVMGLPHLFPAAA
jgi:hypothetical protein